MEAKRSSSSKRILKAEAKAHHKSAYRKQVGFPTKARVGFLKIGLPINWAAALGLAKWGIMNGQRRLKRDPASRALAKKRMDCLF